MLELTDGVRLVETNLDVRKWKLESFGGFSCKSFHSNVIANSVEPLLLLRDQFGKLQFPQTHIS